MKWALREMNLALGLPTSLVHSWGNVWPLINWAGRTNDGPRSGNNIKGPDLGQCAVLDERQADDATYQYFRVRPDIWLRRKLSFTNG